MSKYEQLAEQIRDQIQNEIWAVGEKLPSLRKQAELSSMSLMTVMQAYQLLESQGWIISRQRSGYIVAPKVQEPIPSKSEKQQLKGKVDINDFVFEVLKSSRKPNIISLGSVYPDAKLYPEQHVNKSLISAARNMSAFDTLENFPPGNENLRRIIAKRYAAQGMTVHPDEIVITAGALDALNLCLQAVTQPGDWVIIESPAFYGALQSLQRLNLKALPIKTDSESGIDLDELEAALKSHPVKACWLMTNNQNPTGYTLSYEKKKKLISILSRYNAHLIEDDVYSELFCGDEKPLPAKVFDQKGMAMHCSSFSKSLIFGFRIGWVAAGNMALPIQKLQLMSTLSVSTPIQLALENYLSNKNYEGHLKKLRTNLEANKESMCKLLNNYFPESVKIHHPAGGYFIWIELPKTLDATELYHKALSENISIAPGKMFATDNKFNHCFRINSSFGNQPKAEQAIKKLASIISEMMKKAAI